MKVRELVEWLSGIADQDTEVFYRNPNFGGRGDPLTWNDIEMSGKYEGLSTVLVTCPYWESCEG